MMIIVTNEHNFYELQSIKEVKSWRKALNELHHDHNPFLGFSIMFATLCVPVQDA